MKRYVVLFLMILSIMSFTSCGDKKEETQPVSSNSFVENKDDVFSKKVEDKTSQAISDEKTAAVTESGKSDNGTVSGMSELTFYIDKPASSDIKSDKSYFKIIFSSDDSKRAAKKEFIEQNVNKYVTISPKINGNWVFKGGNYLVFMPESEWKPDTEYKVTINKEIINSEYNLRKSETSFKTEMFTGKIDSTQINIDNNNNRYYNIEVVFNYKVNGKEFAKNSSLTLNGKELDFKATVDDTGYVGTIKSNAFELLDKEQKIEYKLSKLKSADGNAEIAYELQDNFVVPLSSQRFSVKGTSISVVFDEKGNPNHVLTIKFTDTVNGKYVKDAVKLELLPKDISKETKPEDMEKVDLTYIESGNVVDLVHSFRINKKITEPRSFICNVFNKNLKSSTGYRLSSSESSMIDVKPLPATLSILQKGSLMSLKSDKILTFETRGLQWLDTEVGKVLPEQIQHIILFAEDGGLNKVSFKTYLLDETNFTTLKKVKIPLSSAGYSQPSYASVDLSLYSNGEPGLYVVKAKGLDKDGKTGKSANYYNYKSRYYDEYDDYYYDDYSDNDYTEASRFILVTDMYIIKKVNLDGSTDVFVASISDGKPVAKAKIEIMGKNGIPVLSGETDDYGHFRYAKIDLDREKTPVAIVAKKDNDFSFIPLNYDRINYSRFDVGGVYAGSNEKEDLTAMLFTDRGIYRPGENVEIAGIVKNYQWSDVSGIPVELRITSPKSEKVLVEKLSLDSEGFINVPFKTKKDFMTGMYRASLYLLGSDDTQTYIGNTVFEIREFDTDTIRVQAKIKEYKQFGWLKPDKITAQINAQNMIGTPAANRRVKVDVSITPTVFHFNEYKDYNFIDPYRERNNKIKPYNPDVNDGKTDNNGNAEFSLEKYFKSYDYGTYKLSFSGEVFEAGSGDGVTAYANANVSPAEYLVGFRADKYLGYLSLNDKVNAELIAVNNQLEKIAVKNLRYRLVQISYIQQLISTGSGYYRYVPVKKYNIVNSGDISITEKGSVINLPTNISGEFIYEIVDKDTVVGKVGYFVAGSNNGQTDTLKESELILKLDKKEYNNGDTINMSITAPYTGYGLITVEKDKVYSYKWFRADTNSSIQAIKVPESIEGTGYVNIVFVRDISSKDIYTKPMSYAVASFAVNRDKRKINIELKTPKIARPGDNVTVNYKADKDGKIIVYGADEGILQVAGYKLPDPLSFFMKKAALQVSTSQTADLIIPDYKVILDSYATGGAEDAMVANAIAKKLNPFARAIEEPVTFWSKIKTVKAGEEGSITYTIPTHFNGSMKVMAVAVSKDRVGSSETAFIARMPIVLTPNMPYAAVPGDKFKLSVGIANVMENSSGSEEIKVTAEPSKHLEIVGEKTKTVSVKNGSEAVVYYDVIVKDELGGAEINLVTENKNLDEPLKTKITTSVRPAVPYRFEMNMGSFTGKKETIRDIERPMYDFFTSRKGGVSASPLWSLSGLLGYLETYPYGCTEQITSKVYPVILLASVDPSADKKLVQERFDTIIAELRKRQKGTRGFTLWSDGSYIDDVASIYAMQFLTDAKEMGYQVPNDIFSRGIEFLKKKVSEYPDYYYDTYEIAYAAYILARNGVVVTRTLNVLEEFMNKNSNNLKKYEYIRDYYNLTKSLIGASYILLKNDKAGIDLLKMSVPEKRRDYYFYNDYFDSMLNEARYLYLIGRHAPDLVKENMYMVNNLLDYAKKGYFNSFSSAFALAALKGVGAEKEKLTAVITADPANSIKLDTANKNQFTFTADTKNVTVEFPEENELGYYYYTTTGGFDKEIPSKFSNGIVISKRFLDKNGKEISEGRQGDEVTVELYVKRTENNGDYSLNAAITDLLPGGVEIITDKGVKGSYSSIDLREDRAVIYIDLKKKYEGKLEYKIKLLSSGEFTVPPAYIESLYRRSVNGMGSSSKFVIKDGK